MIPWRQEMEQIAIRHRLPMGAIKGADRHRCLVMARRQMWQRLRERGWSFPRIGKEFNRHHTTIMYGLRALDKQIAKRAKEGLAR